MRKRDDLGKIEVLPLRNWIIMFSFPETGNTGAVSGLEEEIKILVSCISLVCCNE